MSRAPSTSGDDRTRPTRHPLSRHPARDWPHTDRPCKLAERPVTPKRQPPPHRIPNTFARTRATTSSNGSPRCVVHRMKAARCCDLHACNACVRLNPHVPPWRSNRGADATSQQRTEPARSGRGSRITGARWAEQCELSVRDFALHEIDGATMRCHEWRRGPSCSASSLPVPTRPPEGSPAAWPSGSWTCPTRGRSCMQASPWQKPNTELSPNNAQCAIQSKTWGPFVVSNDHATQRPFATMNR